MRPTKLLAQLRALLLVLVLRAHCGDGYGCPYGQHCNFEPAPPGQVPRCALPGLTYCVHPEPYPEHVIRHLVEAGQYDIRTLLSDESRDEFTSRREPPPRYGPPGHQPGFPYGYGPNSLPNADQISLVDEPIYIPKPKFNAKFHATYNQGFFSQKTPLQPPSALDPVPYNSNLPLIQTANFSKLTDLRSYQTAPSNFWSQVSSQSDLQPYDKRQYRHSGFSQNQVEYFGDPTGQRYNQALPTGFGRLSTSNGNTPYNRVEWWRYVNPNSRSDVQIEQSISFPVRVLNATRLHGRRKRNAELLRASRERTLTGAEALRIALGLSSEAEAELENPSSRRGRQADSDGLPVEQLCQTRAQYITPRAALNNRGSWKYVVNMPDNMTQLVRAEICTSNVCNGICSLPLGYSSRCEQKYVQKRLVALESNGQNLYTDIFWIPSCCQCTIIAN